MTPNNDSGPWRILIASSHPLFAEGMRSLLHARRPKDAIVVGMVSTIDEALAAIQELHPDLVVVDYDDEKVNREEFLARFVEGVGRLRVVLLSLKEGGQEAIVYDRRSTAASQVEDWLNEWTDIGKTPGAPTPVEAGLPAGSPTLENNLERQRTDKPTRRDLMKHVVGAGLLVIILAVAGLFALQRVELLPAGASAQSIPIDSLFRLDFTAIVILFTLIVGLMIYSILSFRRRKGDTTDGPHVEGNMKLEVAWTIIPLGFVLYVAYIGSFALARVERADPKPVRVDVIGSQWSWRFEYPDLKITSTELLLPVNKQALLRLSSTDVIHSFWVPEFRVKQDALPGEDFVRDLRITPDAIGDYKVGCAELCGRLHYDMRADVKVLSPGAFATWVRSMTEAIPEDPVARGNLWTQQFGCQACHSIDGSPLVGPTWLGIFGSQEQLTDGSTVTVDAAYIAESIHNPGAKIVAGFQNLMPANVGAELTDDQINDIVAFLESLK
jgi:cytochrome c oxidase subunit 2